ncbi:hypothetical protein SKAU_G00351970 [Synaphobranchus kaupii]|uniref:Uncharacterized protein n=1 Tax=Synaphobranchus kaupii TaxID=118154 RepID=A0A9Q1EKJ9_SYNKA|nr:hypothetical protein SKAU_G00351970 [Synaphobranchus kaupii]
MCREIRALPGIGVGWGGGTVSLSKVGSPKGCTCTRGSPLWRELQLKQTGGHLHALLASVSERALPFQCLKKAPPPAHVERFYEEFASRVLMYARLQALLLNSVA